MSFICTQCQSSYERKASRAKTTRFCSRRCTALWVLYNRNKDKFFKRERNFEKNPSWKGGRYIYQGYWVITLGQKKRAFEHRLIMESLIGRTLKKGEVVHHKNHNKLDNRPENLDLFQSHSAHMVHHHQKKHA